MNRIMKRDAMNIESKAWREGVLDKTTNIDSGFRAAGLWNFSFPAIYIWLTLFKKGGIVLSEDNPTWVRCQETVRMEVLSLPPGIDRGTKRRRTFDVKNPLL